MARLNIETRLWVDPRFQDLMIKVGNRHTAKGMVLELWTLAQDAWFPDRRLIPRATFDRAGLAPLIEIGMAEYRDDGVYACGTEESFAWLFERQKAGQKGGEATATKRKSSKAKLSCSKAKRSLSKSKQTIPSISSSISSSLSSSDSSSNSDSEDYSVGAQAPLALGPVRSPVGLFIATYVIAYQKRYGEDARPDLQGKVQTQIKAYVAEAGIERARQMIQTYCQMNDAWFLTKAHDFGTFLANLSKVGVRLDTGVHITGGKAREVERKQDIYDVFAPLIAEAEAKEAARGNA